MSEQQQTQPVFAIQKIYTRNISLESPNAPAIFTVDFKPQLEVDLNVTSEVLEPEMGIFHVVVRVTVTTKIEDRTAFLVEVDQAGIFVIQGYSEQDTRYLLGAQCPNILFPFAREAVSDLVTRAGFPQLLLEPVNFEIMYAEQMQQAAGEQAQ
jgi:preprotein translocase subunit SecB